MKIEFLGGVREVGGSCISVETDYGKIALDYGIKVEDKSPYHLPRDFDATVISHAHLDHSGNLLNLSRGKPLIIGSEVTREIASELFYDMVRIKRQNGEVYPYGKKDVSNLKKFWWPKESTALPGMLIQMYHAGHVAGAKMISIRAEEKTVLYTGDFCLHDTEILDGSRMEDLPENPDILIMETTYGGTERKDRNELVDEFLNQIQNTIDRKGNVLIPAFAFHRSQGIAKIIDQAIEEGKLPSYNLYMISNLARKITAHFNKYKDVFNGATRKQKEPFKYHHVSHLRSTRQIKKPAIVIATSGFGHAGASLRLLKEWASDAKNLILITSGYLPPGSPLKTAKEEGKVYDGSNMITLNARIRQIELSGHADKHELLKFVETIKPKKTFLVHGELDQSESFAEDIHNMTEVHIPERSGTYVL